MKGSKLNEVIINYIGMVLAFLLFKFLLDVLNSLLIIFKLVELLRILLLSVFKSNNLLLDLDCVLYFSLLDIKLLLFVIVLVSF